MDTRTGRSLQSRWLLTIALMLALCQGCGRQESPQTRAPSDDSNSKRRTQISKERGKQADWGLNTCVAAVKQPAFTPLIDREGAIITFDSEGRPLHGITARAHDPVLRSNIPIRQLTRAELDEASSLLQQHFRESIQQGILTVVVHCADLKRAAAEAMGNTSPGVDYFIEADIRTGLCQIFKKTGNVSELIASEKIYYPKQKPTDESGGSDTAGLSKLDAEPVGQVFKSAQGRYQMPLPGGVGTWEHMSPPGGQDIFVHTSNTQTRSIQIQWINQDKSLDSAFSRWKEICRGDTDLKWRGDSEKRIRISERPAVTCRYESSSLYTTYALVRSRKLLYIIIVQSSQSYEDSEDIFKQSCAKMILTD